MLKTYFFKIHKNTSTNSKPFQKLTKTTKILYNQENK